MTDKIKYSIRHADGSVSTRSSKRRYSSAVVMDNEGCGWYAIKYRATRHGAEKEASSQRARCAQRTHLTNIRVINFDDAGNAYDALGTRDWASA